MVNVIKLDGSSNLMTLAHGDSSLKLESIDCSNEIRLFAF